MTESIIKYLKEAQKNSQGMLKQFQEDFSKDPVNALSWSLDTFQASTDLKVATKLLNALESEESNATIESLHKYMQKEINNSSKSPSRSTSPVSNLVSECMRASYAKYLELFQD